ncbi:MAG TPA: ATP-binding protein, partial [Actinomycetes bacterium]|nr:ATP-binding protein [Actinomycetes bacterium]
PKATLERGYSILVGPDGHAVTSVSEIDEGDDLLAYLLDGQLVLEAREVLPVRAVPEAVLQVLSGLLDNAAKHAPDKAPIRVQAHRVGALAVLAVEDTGPGVPAADRERIFERFTQLDSGATRRAGGVGLGLYIARQLANGQGGELLLADPTPPGHGARFELRLPMAKLSFRRPG